MSKRKLTAEFIIESKEIHGNKYDYSLVEYKNNNTKVKIICPEHGIFEIRPNDHISKSAGCKKCNNAGKIKKNNYGLKIKDNFKQIHGNKYDYSLVEYNGYDEKINIICPEHGIFKQTVRHHLKGCGCQKCGNVYTPTNDEFIKKCKEIHGDKYDYSLVEYKNNNTKVKIICPKHGIFEQKPIYHTIKKSGCPICRESKGENIIRNFLIENSIKFLQQKRFKNCKDKKTLPFDFYIKDKNICIEYDGEQHFCDRNTFGGANKLKDIIKKDKIKNTFCEENQIKLFRIKYNDNIIEKLNKIFYIKLNKKIKK